HNSGQGSGVWKSGGLLACRMLLVGFGPAAAEGAVNLDHTEQFIAPRLGKAEFGVEKFLLVVEHFEIAGDAALVAHVGHVGRVALGLCSCLLLLAKFLRALVGDESVGNFAEGALHSLLIDRERFLEAGLGQLEVAAKASAGEQRYGHRRAKLPRA